MSNLETKPTALATSTESTDGGALATAPIVVNATQANRYFSQLLAYVEASGQVVEITKRGKGTVAVLMPVAAMAKPLTDVRADLMNKLNAAE